MSTSSSLEPTGHRDSQAVRASVLDVCLQLGALDNNSVVAEWMFNDPSSDAGTARNPAHRRSRTTRFKEMISSPDLPGADAQEKVPDKRRRRRLIPFSINASALTARLCSKPNTQPTVGAPIRESERPPFARSAAASGRVSLSRGSFFKRAGPDERNDRDVVAVYDGGRVSTNPRSFFQRKVPHVPREERSPSSNATAASFATPIHAEFTAPRDLSSQAHDDDDDDDDDDDESWEEIEAPSSPLPRLPNRGMNPRPTVLIRGERKRQSARTIDTDLDHGEIIHGTTHYNLTFAFPRVMFRRPSRPRRASRSPQRKGPSSNSSPPRATISSSAARRNSTIPTPTPRKQLRILTAKAQRVRSLPGSLPPSPFVLVTSRNNGGAPTTKIVFPADVPAHAASESGAHAKSSTDSMGYHHQFFVQANDGDDSSKPASISVPPRHPSPNAD